MENKHIEIMVKEDGVWLQFVGVNALVSVEGIANKSGPIVKKEIKKWIAKIKKETK